MANPPAGAMSTSDAPVVQTHEADSVLVITINRPKVRNAIDGATARALAQAFDLLDARDDLAVGVLTGAGGTFSAGMRHRPADAEQALLTASAIGAPPVEVAEVRADLMEAVGEHRAALDIRIANSGTLPPAQQLSRIACCQLALGAHHEAVATFASAIRHYAGASPLPLGSMLFNWGHTWEHVGDRGRAELAYHAVMRYLPSHVRAHSALVERSSDHGSVGRKLSTGGV